MGFAPWEVEWLALDKDYVHPFPPNAQGGPARGLSWCLLHKPDELRLIPWTDSTKLSSDLCMCIVVHAHPSNDPTNDKQIHFFFKC